jgi:hypothetical protein
MSGNTLREVTKRLWLAHEAKLAFGEDSDEAEYREAFDDWIDFCRQEFGEEEIAQEQAEGTEDDDGVRG